jgi:hypothetical protein
MRVGFLDVPVFQMEVYNVVKKPGSRIEYSLKISEDLIRLGKEISKIPLKFVSLMRAFPSKGNHQEFHADSEDGERAILYLTNVDQDSNGPIEFQSYGKLLGKAGTFVHYSANEIHRGCASDIERYALAFAFDTNNSKKITTIGTSVITQQTLLTNVYDLFQNASVSTLPRTQVVPVELPSFQWNPADNQIVYLPTHFTSADNVNTFRPFYTDYSIRDSTGLQVILSGQVQENNSLHILGNLGSAPPITNLNEPSLYVFDGERANMHPSSNTMIRAFNDNEIVDNQPSYTTMSVVRTRQFFSWTGCSYSLNDSYNSPNAWSKTCGIITSGGLSQESNTVYVYGSYVSESAQAQPPGSLLFWALNPGTGQSNYFPPDKLSYLLSDSKLDIDANLDITPNRPRASALSLTQFYVPLLPNEDFYQVLQLGSTTQYQSSTGFGNWPNASGQTLLSMTSVSFIGAYSYEHSYSQFSFTKGQFLIYSSLSGSNSILGDDIYFCDGAKCNSISSQSGGSFFRLTALGNDVAPVPWWQLDSISLYTTFTLLRGGSAFYSLTQNVSTSFIDNPFSLTYDNLCQNVGDKGLVYGENIGAVLPKENVTFIQRTENILGFDPISNYKTPPYFYKIPTIVNPGFFTLTKPYFTTVSTPYALTYNTSFTFNIQNTFVKTLQLPCNSSFNPFSNTGFSMRFLFSSPVTSWSVNPGWTFTGPLEGEYYTLILSHTSHTPTIYYPNLTLSFDFLYVPDFPTVIYTTDSLF